MITLVLPVGASLDTGEMERRIEPSKTYAIDAERGVVRGYVDEAAAVAQAIWKVLQTERFAHIIYSSDYGVTLNDLIGADRGFAEAELERRIKEALMVDDRILDVRDFAFEYSDDVLIVTCRVDTIFGPVPSVVRYSV